MKKFICFLVALCCIAYPATATSDDCDGPPELCEQLSNLQQQLDKQKVDSAEKVNQTAVNVATDKEKDINKKAATAVAGAASIAAILKMLLSVLKSSNGFFTTDNGKAAIKALTIVVAVIAFGVGNVALGMTWWQSVILASGGPGAIVVHELSKLWLVFQGKEKYDDKDFPDPIPNMKKDTKTEESVPEKAPEVVEATDPVVTEIPKKDEIKPS